MWYALVFCLSAREKLDRFARDLGTAYVDLWRLSGVPIAYHWTLAHLARKSEHVGRHRCAGRVSWRAEREMRERNERSRGNKVEFAALMRSVRRINDWLDETPPQVLEARPAWDQPTMWEIPDVGEAQRITYGVGASHYDKLLTSRLDAEAAEAKRLIDSAQIQPVFTRTEMQFADYDEIRMKEWREEFADA